MNPSVLINSHSNGFDTSEAFVEETRSFNKLYGDVSIFSDIMNNLYHWILGYSAPWGPSI